MLLVELAKDRTRVGRLTLVDWRGEVIAGPFPALAKADKQSAIRNGNPKRNPIKPFGDTPTGLYELSITHPLTPPRSYGIHAAFRMNPVSGQALQAKINGRSGLLIHGGTSGAGGRLRPTHGCIRLFDEDIKILLDVVSEHKELLRCTVNEGFRSGDAHRVLEGRHYELDDIDLHDDVYPDTEAPTDVPGLAVLVNAAPAGLTEFTINTDLKLVDSPLSVADIEAFFSAQPQSKRGLGGIGQAVIDASKAQRVNASYLVAHAILETGWGTSRIFREKNNLFGWTAYDSNPGDSATKFSSREECIAKVVPIINANYLTPTGKYFSKKCCVGNKKYGMNVHYASDPDWGAKIASIARRLEREGRLF